MYAQPPPPSPPPPLYALDKSWQPQFPDGAHTFSAVAVSPSGAIYVSQRGNTSISPILVLDRNGTLLRSWGAKNIATRTAQSTKTWGAHGVFADRDVAGGPDRVWVCDFFAHALVAFDDHGIQQLTIGTPGIAGNGTSPAMQFGSVADAVTDGKGGVYSSDGDGGINNRVVKLQQAVAQADTETGVVPPTGGGIPPESAHFTFVWATPSVPRNGGSLAGDGDLFSSPHSLALHPRSGLLLVADRGHSSTRLLRASDGKDLGRWDCGLEGGGRPFGVRFYSGPHRHGGLPLADDADGAAASSVTSHGLGSLASGAGTDTDDGTGTDPADTSAPSLDLLLLATYDNPPTGEHQRLFVIDASPLRAWAEAVPSVTEAVPSVTEASSLATGSEGGGGHGSGRPACHVLQELPIDPSRYSGPHLLGVDPFNGDIYAALIADAPLSTVLRFRQREPPHNQIAGEHAGSGGGGLLVLVVLAAAACLWFRCAKRDGCARRTTLGEQEAGAGLRSADASAVDATAESAGGAASRSAVAPAGSCHVSVEMQCCDKRVGTLAAISTTPEAMLIDRTCEVLPAAEGAELQGRKAAELGGTF